MRARDKGKEPKVKKKPGRAPTSCAECRRLKLRCDKNVPCEKCVSRGCAEICPTGILASTKGNRMVLSGTEELHERISELQARVRDMEFALSQAGVSDEVHSLLGQDILQPPPLQPPQPRSSPASGSSSSKFSGASRPSPTSDQSTGHVLKEEEGDSARIDAFGTLTIGSNGAAIYIGKTARSEFLIRAPLEQEADSIPPSSHLRSHFPDGLASSPFPDLDVKETPYLEEQVYKMLPPLSEAMRLCEVYLSYGKSMYTPISRTELLDEILMTIYRSQSYEAFQSHHALALLFSIFALASHFDPHKEPYSIESQEYYQLARTTLGFASPVRQTTLAAIQTLIHMAQYLDFTDSGCSSAWIYIGHAVRFAFSIGLHLNGARWGLPSDDIERRSRVFWHLFTLDTWTSFYFGRPPGISPSFIDCQYPRDTEDVSFHSWSYRFTSLMSSTMASGMGPRPPAYTTILELDRQIRDFHIPETWRATTEAVSPTLAPEVHLYRWLVLANKETVLLNLHRSYFAQALYDSPDDIQRHRYLPSVVAIYRATWRLIQGLQIAWANASSTLLRVHLPWSQALSAAIVLCVLVTKIPASHLTTFALEELEALYSLFHVASASSRPAAALLPSIQSLCQKAQEATDPARHHAAGYSQPPITQIELDRLSGGTHLFSDTQGSVSSTPREAPSVSSPPFHQHYSREKARSRSTSVTLSDNPDPAGHLHAFSIPTSSESSSSSQPLHPTILEDLKDFSARNAVPSLRSLSDSPSNSEVTPTGVVPPVVDSGMSMTPPGSSSSSSSDSAASTMAGSSSAAASYFGRQSQTPRRSQQQQNYDDRPPTPSYSHSGHPSGSAESTPRTARQSHPPHETPSPLHFLPPHRSSGYSQASMPSSSSQHPTTTLRSSLQPSSSSSSVPPRQPEPQSSQPTQSLLGFTTEFQNYYESMEMRRSTSGVMGMGTLGIGGSSGFVTGFEPGGPLILDSTWHGFVEQLGF